MSIADLDAGPANVLGPVIAEMQSASQFWHGRSGRRGRRRLRPFSLSARHPSNISRFVPYKPYLSIRIEGSAFATLVGGPEQKRTVTTLAANELKFEMLSEGMRVGKDRTGWRFEIADEDGTPVLMIPFSEAIRGIGGWSRFVLCQRYSQPAAAVAECVRFPSMGPINLPRSVFLLFPSGDFVAFADSRRWPPACSRRKSQSAPAGADRPSWPPASPHTPRYRADLMVIQTPRPRCGGDGDGRPVRCACAHM